MARFTVRSLVLVAVFLGGVGSQACSSSSSGDDTTPVGTPDASKHHDATSGGNTGDDATLGSDGNDDETPDATDETTDDGGTDGSLGDGAADAAAAASDAGSASDAGDAATVTSDGATTVADASDGASSTGVDAGADAGLDATTPDAGPLPPYAGLDPAGLAAYCAATCGLSVTCYNAAHAVHVDGGACQPCIDPSPKLRADLIADTTSCVNGLGAGVCGDAGGALSDCFAKAEGEISPSPATTTFCNDNLLFCTFPDCAASLASRSDPTVLNATACFADAGGGDAGLCGNFSNCVSRAVN